MSENSENQEDEVKGDQASLRTKNSGVEIYRKWRLTGIHLPIAQNSSPFCFL